MILGTRMKNAKEYRDKCKEIDFLYLDLQNFLKNSQSPEFHTNVFNTVEMIKTVINDLRVCSNSKHELFDSHLASQTKLRGYINKLNAWINDYNNKFTPNTAIDLVEQVPCYKYIYTASNEVEYKNFLDSLQTRYSTLEFKDFTFVPNPQKLSISFDQLMSAAKETLSSLLGEKFSSCCEEIMIPSSSPISTFIKNNATELPVAPMLSKLFPGKNSSAPTQTPSTSTSENNSNASTPPNEETDNQAIHRISHSRKSSGN